MILRHNTEPLIIGSGCTNLGNLRVNRNNTSIATDNINLLLNNTSETFVPVNLDYSSDEGKILIDNNQVFITGNNIYSQLANLLSLREKGIMQPNMILKDNPKVYHREFMLDIARNYVSLDEIKKIVDEMFKNRINYLHLHISDDQNYGIESRVHPELNTKPFLTISEIKELISYCSNRGIEIIPEFDMPGHLNHLLDINIRLRCNPKKGNSLCFWGEHEYIYEIIDELCAIFPGEYFHIGADELGLKQQSNCPLCLDLMSKKGYTNLKQLACDFINKIASYVFSKGKKVIVWNDALRYGHINDDVIVQKWFNYSFDKTCLDEYKRGRKFIIGSATDTYFDMPYSLTPLRKTYHYIPEINGNIVEKPYGISSHLWTEIITEEDDLEIKLFPRLEAFGENAWVDNNLLDYKDFLLRLRKEMLNLDINYHNLDDIDKFKLMEVMDFLKGKMSFKNYTDFKTIDLLKMFSEYYFPRGYHKLKRSK